MPPLKHIVGSFAEWWKAKITVAYKSWSFSFQIYNFLKRVNNLNSCNRLLQVEEQSYRVEIKKKFPCKPFSWDYHSFSSKGITKL